MRRRCRSPCCAPGRSRDSCWSYSRIIASRATLATMEAAAMETKGVALDDRPLRARRRRARSSASTRRGPGATARPCDGPLHGQVGRAQDVEAVDLRRDRRRPRAQTRAPSRGCARPRRLALARGEALGVVEPVGVEAVARGSPRRPPPARRGRRGRPRRSRPRPGVALRARLLLEPPGAAQFHALVDEGLAAASRLSRRRHSTLSAIRDEPARGARSPACAPAASLGSADGGVRALLLHAAGLALAGRAGSRAWRAAPARASRPRSSRSSSRAAGRSARRPGRRRPCARSWWRARRCRAGR